MGTCHTQRVVPGWKKKGEIMNDRFRRTGRIYLGRTPNHRIDLQRQPGLPMKCLLALGFRMGAGADDLKVVMSPPLSWS